MKKKLIALFALTGVAVGADSTFSLDDALYTSTNGATITTDTTGDNVISGDFTLTMTLNADAVKTIFGTTSNRPTYFYVDTTNNTYITLTNALNNTGFVGMSANNLNSYIAGGTGDPARYPMTTNGSTPSTNNFADSSINGNVKSKLSSLTDVVLTLTHDNTTSTSLYATLKFADNTTTQVWGTNTDLKWRNGIGSIESVIINSTYVKDTYLFKGMVDKDTAFALNDAAIPEPTTATLSLLALAGLAARRRRASR